MLMKEALKMSSQANSEDIPNATSSRVLESGVTPSVKQDGLMTGESGLGLVRANLSARQAKEQGLPMSGTFGQRSSISSASVNLTRSLASKLRAKTDLL